MAHTELIQRMRPPQVIEGTPEEIAERLKTLEGDQRLTLIIPGEPIETTEQPEEANGQFPPAGRTFREIFAPSQTGFDQTGMTDDALSDFLETEVKACRAERKDREPTGE